MTAFAQHLRQEALLATTPSIRGRLRGGSDYASPEQVRAQATLLRLVSITEAYASMELVRCLEHDTPKPRSPLIESIVIGAEDRALSTWHSLADHYKDWLGIGLRNSPVWKPFNAAVNARNAAAHGLGELTRRQARKNSTQLVADLKALDITVQNGRMTISRPALRNVVTACREVIRWIDIELDSHPEYRAAAGASK
ncbi:MAG TPA: hypothetical protein VF519_13450 [Mycobacteriales bacterium]|jgi:hypothetical protein